MFNNWLCQTVNIERAITSYLAHSLHNVQLTDYRGNTFREAGLEEDAENSLVEIGDLGQLEQEPETEGDRRTDSQHVTVWFF